MPKRQDIKSILIIGAGPIIIGQGCEFDYSGAQACKALKEEGYRVILINSNPATIMTDPQMADATYIEPINWQSVAAIIEKEKPDALLPTMGGQTALNTALDLVRLGILEKNNVELIGASKEAIDKAEDRDKFAKAMRKIGLDMPRSRVAHTIEEARLAQQEVGFPTIIRPSFTLGGSGGGIAYNVQEFNEICTRGLELSPTSELLIEESIIGWKEYELEVVRDKKDNCIIICSIENIDAMGVHTGDSITVAPAQTLTDKEYQRLRDASIKVLREIGVETGGSNVQFAINPKNGHVCVIEMNPRVSRSSALASKATGFPIAKVAAKLAVGYTLDELQNEITGGKTPASFEPSIDYVVTKIPRFAFEKFPKADDRLTTQMKSVGEVMAMGRTFSESLQKALRGLEVGADGLDPKLNLLAKDAKDTIRSHLKTPRWDRIWYVADAFRLELSVEDVNEMTGIDPWFLVQIQTLVDFENQLVQKRVTVGSERNLLSDIIDKDTLLTYKRLGFSDKRLATLCQVNEDVFRAYRHSLQIRPSYKRIDTCAGEFSSSTAYMYSTYEPFCEAKPTDREKIIVLGGGPNRIGQGIEFDYCCVHAALALKEDGYETIMINCNPETVSTDYDTSDRLYFESLTLEDVLEIVHLEKPKGVIVQYGGQTPLKLARLLEAQGVPIIGTTPDAIDEAEDRQRFGAVISKLKLNQPPNGTVTNVEDGLKVASQIGYPLMVRPSYVLGGRAMEVVYNDEDLITYMREAVKVSNDSPVLLDRFLDDAIEVDVDAVCDGSHVTIGAIMEHIEQAGVHSGDSACALPSFSLSDSIKDELRTQMKALALELKVVGLLNAQFAIKDDKIYVLEVNPRASRTIPFVSKAIGIPLAKIGARVMAGKTLKSLQFLDEVQPKQQTIKKSVFPFIKFPGVDPILGPEMRSTGEVMGMGSGFGQAFAKAHMASDNQLVEKGLAFLSVRDADKINLIEVASRLIDLGFKLVATRGTANALERNHIPCEYVNKVSEGRPNTVDLIKNGKITFIVNTTEGRQAIADSFSIRKSAIEHKICYVTTLAGGKAMALALKYQNHKDVVRLQDLHKQVDV